MKVVSNSGPLINLAKVGQFTLLRDLFQHITIPPAVFEEVVVYGEEASQGQGRPTRPNGSRAECSSSLTFILKEESYGTNTCRYTQPGPGTISRGF